MKFKKFLIALFFISIIYESRCEKSRLRHIVYNINETKQHADDGDHITKYMDVDCVKNFFKFPQNEKMIVSEIEEYIVTVAAALKCADEDKAFKYYVDDFIYNGYEDNLFCLKWHLQKLEPTSKLIENFEVKEDDFKKCKKTFLMNDIVQHVKRFESKFGTLREYSCGAVTGVNDYIKFFSKRILLKNVDNTEELKKAEMEKLKEYFKKIAFTTANCIIERFEKNLTAHLINDTLNYFFKKTIKPIDYTNEYDPLNYYKNLAKLEASIDVECVKEKLNLLEFGEILLIEVEATIVIASAKSKCIKIDPIDFSYLFLNLTIKNFQMSDEYVSCAKYKLKKLEPTSKLAEIKSSDEVYEKDCSDLSISYHPPAMDPIHNYQYSVGSFNETTCGVLSNEIVEVISYKILLLASEKDEELRRKEMKQVFTITTEILQKFADCIFESVK